MSLDPPKPLEPDIVPPQHHGAVYTPLHVERRVKIYPIQEHELTTLNMFSAAVTICSSIVSGTVVFMLSVLWDLVAATDPMAIKVGRVASGICFFVIAICVTIAWSAYRKRDSELAKILSESRGAGS